MSCTRTYLVFLLLGLPVYSCLAQIAPIAQYTYTWASATDPLSMNPADILSTPNMTASNTTLNLLTRDGSTQSNRVSTLSINSNPVGGYATVTLTAAPGYKIDLDGGSVSFAYRTVSLSGDVTGTVRASLIADGGSPVDLASLGVPAPAALWSYHQPISGLGLADSVEVRIVSTYSSSARSYTIDSFTIQGKVVSAGPPPVCTADVDANNLVNLVDAAIILSNLNAAVPANTLGDLDGNALVDLADLQIWINAFGTTCP